MKHEPDNAPGNYYVTCRRDNGGHALLVGPFAYHQQALDTVDDAKSIAMDVDPRAPWYSYGTARMALDITRPLWRTGPGILNARLGIK